MEKSQGQQIAEKGASYEQMRKDYASETNIDGWKSRELSVMNMQEKVLEEASNALGSEFHEEWRKTRLDDEGNFEPRVKETKDAAWIEANGTDQVDIANSTFDQLPEDWKAENKAAADVVVGVMVARNGEVNLADEATRNEVGGIVHDAWLSRNEWAAGGDLDKPFDQLPLDEQAKDISQVEVAQRVFEVS